LTQSAKLISSFIHRCGSHRPFTSTLCDCVLDDW